MADVCVVGVDLGGTKLLAGALDERLNVRHRAHRWVQDLEAGDLLDTIVAAVEEVRGAADRPVDAVGFGIPCLIDRRRRVAAVSNHLPLVDVPFADVMAERLGVPVFVDNDGNASVLAEARSGAAAGARDVVMLTIGTGIGGGLFLDGAVYRGSVGSAADLGHVVIEMDGPPCPGNCSGRGCLEVYVSGPALGREGERMASVSPESGLARAAADGREVTGALVTELAHDGDAAAVAAVSTVGRRLGIGLVSLVNALNPEVVVIGGGVIGAGDLLLGPAREVVATRALPLSRDVVRIVPARFGAEAGMVGAGVMALERAGAVAAGGSG